MRSDAPATRSSTPHASASASEFGVEVGLPPETALDWAVEAVTRSGYGLENRTPNTVTFARHEGADSCLGCFLMIFLLVPGILYLLLAERTVRFTIAAYPIEKGCRLVIGGDYPNAVEQAIDWARRLPKPGEWEPERPGAKTSSAESMTRKRSPAQALRELAELKDAGIITPEEFEAKKAEMLRRM